MPAYGYDFAANGILTPFTINSVMGGELYLLPSPDAPGQWKTWGFNPYDPAGDVFSEVGDIGVEGVAMRVPLFHVNMADEPQNPLLDYAVYLMDGVRNTYDGLRGLVQATNVDSALSPEISQKAHQYSNQLVNSMQAIAVYNQMPRVQQGELPPLTPKFGDRYRVEYVNPQPETIEQQVEAHYVVIDMAIPPTEDRVVLSTTDRIAAEEEARVLNENNLVEWIEQEINGLDVPGDHDNDVDRVTLRDFFVNIGATWGTNITQNDLSNAINTIWTT